MKANLVRIGNSQGVRIPKPIIEECGFGATVELTVRDKTVVIAPARRPREGWDDAFREMARRGDDKLLDPETATVWDKTEWQW